MTRLVLAVWLLTGLSSTLLPQVVVHARAEVAPAPPAVAEAPNAPEANRHFTERVLPLLQSRCIGCHGPEKQKGGLRMDSRDALLKGGEAGPAIVPGNAAASLLVQAVTHTKPDLEMPPKEKLSERDIQELSRWIQSGAPWPVTATASATTSASTDTASSQGQRIGDAWSDPRNPIVRIFRGERLNLWSLRPLEQAQPPQVPSRANPRNAFDSGHPVDRFLRAQLDTHGLRPAPEADPRTLVRRLYLDLAGLPPSPEQLAAALADRSPDSWPKLVDSLLASAHYGEHWARMWLDVVRYSDSNGFDWDEFRPRAWRFRDYVIRSFNSDKPFDRFIVEQLAGDELLDGPPKNPAAQDALIATTYLRLGPQDNSAPLFNEQSRARHELLSDLTETTASAFLGLTMACCRCHDHKYDPLSQADHFRLRAFFEPSKYADDLPLDLADVQASIREHNKSVESRLDPLRKERSTLLQATKDRLKSERIAKLDPEKRALAQSPETSGSLSDDQKKRAQEILKSVEPSEKDIDAALTTEDRQRATDLQKQMDSLASTKRSFTYGLLMTDTTDPVPATHVLYQGNHKAERETVVPGFPSALDPNPAVLERPTNPRTTGRRLTLARWIASNNNPLTARVLVNRVWQGYFGTGLVATANDFGLAGARPSHPALLDWLASDFMRHGWSLKHLHRVILTSAAYRQSVNTPESLAGVTGTDTTPAAKIDRSNSLLWRQNLRRLSAEQLRDAVLHVSGLLKDRDGGAPVWPPLPPEVLQANPAFLDDNAEKTKGWYPSPDTEQTVRSLYLVQKRTVRLPFMETFDLPENSTSCPRRNASIVAPQALALLNNSLTLTSAQALADRILNEPIATPAQQVARAFDLVLQRRPAPDESRACESLLRTRGLMQLCRALLNLNEFAYID